MIGRNTKRQLVFFASSLFFGCGLLLANRLVEVRCILDYLFCSVLTLASGLGLTIMVLWWLTDRTGKDGILPALPLKVSRWTAGRCG